MSLQFVTLKFYTILYRWPIGLKDALTNHSASRGLASYPSDPTDPSVKICRINLLRVDGLLKALQFPPLS